MAGPEVGIVSALIVSVLLLVNGRLLLPGVLASLAAQHAPPLGLLSTLPVILLLKEAYQVRKSALVALGLILKMVIIGLVLLSSAMFYFYLFGVPNLIMSVGLSDWSLISVKRVGSLFFSLDEGLVRGMPGFIVALAVMTLFLFVYREWKLLGWMAVGSISSILISIPITSTTNWNPGTIVFLRYCYWVAVPLWIAFAHVINVLAQKGLSASRAAGFIIALVISGQLILFSATGIQGKQVYYLNFSAASLWLMRNFPHWYNPIPRSLRKGRKNKRVLRMITRIL